MTLEIYEAVRSVPPEAKKTIAAGRLKGMTDINPMWRIQKLTEVFGPCGVGWKYTIDKEWTTAGANGEVAAFVDISLYYKHEGAWSEAVPGTGGSSFVSKERGGLYTSDECFKMALTDALSVACKALGFGADVYWEKGRTKYSGTGDNGPEPERGSGLEPERKNGRKQAPILCELCQSPIKDYFDGHDKIPAAAMAKRSSEKYGHVYCIRCARKVSNEVAG